MKLDLSAGEASRRARALFNLAVSDFCLEEKFKKGVAVAFSGGADSVFLLLCMKELSLAFGFPLCAIHVNHHIRGEEAERDAEFCRSFCAQNDIKFYRYDADVPALSAENGLGTEEMARNVRYNFFDEFLKGSEEYTYIATAHNSTDNAETVIFNMLRGGASRAMCGIPPVRGNILRPIIYISKTYVVDALKENGIGFVFDSTNKDTSYTRNYIREEIIPRCYRVNPSFESAVQRLNKNMRADMAFIESYVDGFCDERGIKNSAKRGDLEKLDLAILSRVIIRMYGSVSSDKETLSFSHIEKVVEIIKGEDNIGKSYCLPNGILFSSDRRHYKFEKRECRKEDKGFFLELKMGENPMPDLVSSIYLTNEENDEKSKQLKNVYKLSIRANLSSAKINGNLYARNKKNGDSYRYGNMTHKLKKLFNDKKLSEKEKRTVPLICDDDGIVWIPGFPVRNQEKGRAENSKDFNLYAYYYTNGGKDE